MPSRPTLLFLSGSIRKGSLNTQLARQACDMAGSLECDPTFIDLSEYPMPLYHGDLEAEEGLPASAKELKQVFAGSQGFLIASPEYNSSFSPLLKNTLDWISRPHTENEAPLVAYRGKVAALTAASPGGFGGLRGLTPLRMMLGNIGVHVIPDQLAISHATKAFDAEGNLTDERASATLRTIVEQLAQTAQALQN